MLPYVFVLLLLEPQVITRIRLVRFASTIVALLGLQINFWAVKDAVPEQAALRNKMAAIRGVILVGTLQSLVVGIILKCYKDPASIFDPSIEKV